MKVTVPARARIDYDKVWHVRQRISGDIEGEGGWCIDRTEARRLIRLVRRVPTEGHEITPLEREGLVEIGHVLIDGLLDGLTSALGIKLAASVPTLREDLGARAEGRPRGVCVSLSHRVNGERSVSKLGLTWTPTSAGALQRALALYVSPFLAQLTEFRS